MRINRMGGTRQALPALCALTGQSDPALQPRHLWPGVSGRLYPHAVYTLRECPELSGVHYMLVCAGEDGERRVLRCASASHHSGSFNLANIRQVAAQLGANEVHVFLSDPEKPREALNGLIDLSLARHGAAHKPTERAGKARLLH